MLQKAGVAELVLLVEAAGRSKHLLLLTFVLLRFVCCSPATHGIYMYNYIVHSYFSCMLWRKAGVAELVLLTRRATKIIAVSFPGRYCMSLIFGCARY